MATVFEIGLANAVVATLLGAGTFLLGRRLRRPAVIHVLWIVVLVKLITPPLFSLPLPNPGLSSTTAEDPSPASADSDTSNLATEAAAEQNAEPNPQEPVPSPLETTAFPSEETSPFDNAEQTGETAGSPLIETNRAETVGFADGSRTGQLEASTEEGHNLHVDSSHEAEPPKNWSGIILPWLLRGLSGVWILGSLGFIGLMWVRVRRFGRLLEQTAEAAPEDLCREMESLARSMGLVRIPRLVLVPGTLSPLVWALASPPIIVFPKSLLALLDAPGRRSLLLHELTHLRRRDHWVRGLELIVGCLYWWLPLVWLARRELQQAEEECCDAWVVWRMRGERQPYAKALLQTLDFLHGVPSEMPPAASGLGHLAFLRQRLQGILRADVPRSLGWRGTVAIVLCSLAVLPAIPTWGQTGPVEESSNQDMMPPNASGNPPVNPSGNSNKEAAATSTFLEVAKQFDFQRRPVLDSIEFQPRPQTFPPIVQHAQGSVFSGDGRWLMTVYGRTHETGEVRIWDVANRTVRTMWKEPTGIRAVAMAPDGRTFAYGTYGGVIQLGDMETGELKPAWEQTTNGVESLAFSSDGKWLATGSTDGVADVWEVATGKIIQSLRGHKEQIYGIGFLPDNDTLVTAGRDKTLKFWKQSTGKEIRSLPHPNQMFSMSVAPDGKLVATGCQDGNVRLWDAATGDLKTTLAPRRGAISVAFSPSGDTLAASNGGTVTLWDIKTGESQAIIDANHGNVHHVAISRDGKTLATTSWDRSVKLWNIETRTELASLMPAPMPDDESRPVLAMAWSPDNSLVASAHDDKSVRVRDGSTGEVRAVLKGHEDVVSDLKFSPDGKILATASLDHTLKLWRIVPAGKADEKNAPQAWEPFQTFKGHDNWVMCVAFSPDGTRVASGSYDRTIRIWDVRQGKELQNLKGHTAAVRSLVFVSKNRLASGGSDHTVKLWDLGSSRELASLKKHRGAVRALAFSPLTQMLASASEDKTVNLWDLAQWKPEQPAGKMPVPAPRTLEGHTGMIWSLAFSPGGTVLASGDLAGQIKLWNPATGKERATLKGHEDIVTTLAFAPNSRFLLSGSYDSKLLRWKGNAPRPTLSEIATISQPENRVRVGMISPDGRWLALGGGRRETELYDLKALDADPLLLDQGKSTSHLAFSPDGRRLAIGTYSGEIKLWDMHEKHWLPELKSHQGQVQRVTFSPDGKQLASVGWDHVLKLWDLSEGQLLATSPKQPLLMSDVVFAPDGKSLATCSGNWKEWRTPGEIKLWSTDPLKEIKVLGGHEQEIRGVVFTPDGDRLVSYSSSSAGTTRVWDLKTGKELGRFAGCAALTLLPGGRQAITGDLYGKMRLWDLETFKPLSNFTGHADLIYTLSSSPDGSLLASVCRDGAVTLWPTKPVGTAQHE